MKKAIGLIILLSVMLAACVPAANTNAPQYDSSDGARVFTMHVDGQVYNASNTVFTYSEQDYEISFEVLQAWINFDLVNTSDQTIRVLWDKSAIVLPDGQTSRVVSDATSWGTRNNPQAPTVVPTGATLSDAFNPLVNVTQGTSGLAYYFMFDYPIRQTTTIRLLLALQVGDEEMEQEFVFTAQPEQAASN